MRQSEQLPTWAPRVPQGQIRRLYEMDALGIYDDNLLDEVGWALRARCRSFIAAVEPVRGRAPYPVCGEIIYHHAVPDDALHCASCGWESTWRACFGAIQHKQLSGADPVLAFFREFVEACPSAQSPQRKMLQIDRLIPGFHYDLRSSGPRRRRQPDRRPPPRGRRLPRFLSHGDRSTPGIREAREAWRRTVDATADIWKDERLRHKPECKPEV